MSLKDYHAQAVAGREAAMKPSTPLAKAVTRANLQEQRCKELSLDLIHANMERDAAVAEARTLRTELAEVKAHYRLAEAELALAKAAYAGVVAKLGADDETDESTKADEDWLRAREEAA